MFLRWEGKQLPRYQRKISKCGRIQKIIDASKKCVFTYISPQNLSHLSQMRKSQGESKPLPKRLYSETLDKTFDRFLAADGDLVAAEAHYH